MKLTVIIPCRNEVKFIEECIDAIFLCTLPDNTLMSVFVVDGMSNDGTRELVESLMDKYPNLNLVDNEKQLTPYAFNLGIYAGGKVDFAQIVGARHILSTNYLSNCIQKLQSDDQIWCVGGRIINEYINSTGSIISRAMATAFGMGLGNFRTLEKSGFTDTVTSPMYPYKVFEKIGFFDEDLIRNQDDDFNYRVKKAGGKIYYDHTISLKYYVRGNYKGLWRQFFQYGYWKVFVNKKHKAVTTMRQLVPPIFVFYLLSLPLTALGGLTIFFVAMIPLNIYLFVNLIFSLKATEKSGDFPQLFLTYLILHLSYGLGYLKGAVDFIVLNKMPSVNQKRLSR